MYTFLSIIYVLVCSFLIMVVLLQQGRGGMGSLGGGGQTVFGGSGAGNVLTRLTTVSAALFMILSGTLAWMSSSTDTTLDEAMEQREERNRASLQDAIEGGDEAEATPTDGEEAPAPEAVVDPSVPAEDEALPDIEAVPQAIPDPIMPDVEVAVPPTPAPMPVVPPMPAAPRRPAPPAAPADPTPAADPAPAADPTPAAEPTP